MRNEKYKELPQELKKLAEHVDLPYDKGYDYIKDMDIFLKYEREEKGLVGISLSCYPKGDNSECGSSNELAYSFLKISYSPTIELKDVTLDTL